MSQKLESKGKGLLS